jgi:hypothetical protein
MELGEHEAGVWALAADAQGRLLVTGTEEGCVAVWDARSRGRAWQVRACAAMCRPVRLHAEEGCVAA